LGFLWLKAKLSLNRDVAITAVAPDVIVNIESYTLSSVKPTQPQLPFSRIVVERTQSYRPEIAGELCKDPDTQCGYVFADESGSLLPLRRSSWYAAAVCPHEHTLSGRGIPRYVSVKTFDLDSIILAALMHDLS
jgi:hypothetical protein